MSTKQKFHNITMAANAIAENFHFERLASDPLPISASRIWFNTTEKQFKFSSLDAGGAVTINAFANVAALTAAIAALQTSLDAESAARTTADTTELNARVAAVAALTTAIANEVADRTAADAAEATARQDGDATEATNRTAAIAVAAATAANATATEATSRLAGDAALGVRVDDVQTELNATQAGAGLNVDGTFTAPENTTYLGDVTTLKAADVALDTALTAEVAARIAVTTALGSALVNEAQIRADADANLQEQLEALVLSAVGDNAASDAAEAAARIAKDAQLQTELDTTQAAIGLNTDGTMGAVTTTNFMNGASTVFGAAFALDTQLKVVTDAVAAETTARATADTNFNVALQAEIVNRAETDDAQQQELNRTQTGAGLETDGQYAAPTLSNYLGAATSLKDADAKLDAATKAVSNRVTAIEDVAIPELQAQITAEVQRATDAETTEANARAAAIVTVGAAVTAETTRASGIEAGLRTDLTAETAARNTAISAVTSGISAETTRATEAEANLQTQVNAVVAAAGNGAAALKTELNANRYTFQSVAPALEHTVTHGMNTLFFSAEIMVKGSDGLYHRDIMPVTIIDSNSYKIELSEAADVIASGQSNADLA